MEQLPLVLAPAAGRQPTAKMLAAGRGLQPRWPDRPCLPEPQFLESQKQNRIYMADGLGLTLKRYPRDLRCWLTVPVVV